MAFADIVQQLIPKGSTLPGATRNVITREGDIVPSNTIDRSFSGKLVRALDNQGAEKKKKEQEQMDKVNKQLDMYRTLRDAGYEPKAAFEAVQNNEFPDTPSQDEREDAKSVADLEQTQAKTAKIKAETDNIKREKSSLSISKKELLDNIIVKVSKDEKLTGGEQRIYDDVIKKGGTSDLEIIARNIKNKGTKDLLGSGDEETEFIPMVDPKGVNKKVHPDDVEKALKQGWKRR